MVGTWEVPIPPMMLAMIRLILTLRRPERDDGPDDHHCARDLAWLQALAEDRPAEGEDRDRLEIERGDVRGGGKERLEHEKRGDRRAVKPGEERQAGPPRGIRREGEQSRRPAHRQRQYRPPR